MNGELNQNMNIYQSIFNVMVTKLEKKFFSMTEIFNQKNESNKNFIIKLNAMQ